MDGSEELYSEFKLSKPFIYEIYSEFYVLGAGIFRKCGEEEKKLYLKYRNEIQRIINLGYQPRLEEVKILRDYVESIMKLVDVEYETGNDKKFREDLHIFLDENKHLNINQLLLQKKLFIESLNYIEGAFYRHYDKSGKRKA